MRPRIENILRQRHDLRGERFDLTPKRIDLTTHRNDRALQLGHIDLDVFRSRTIGLA